MTAASFEFVETVPATGSTGVELPQAPTTTVATLARRFGMLRDETTALGEDVGTNHRAAQRETLELLARSRMREDVPTLLDELSTARGLAWTDIALLISVSVQAVRKWRRHEAVSGENRLAVSRLAALLDMLSSEAMVQDPAGWLEVPVLAGFSPRHLDLYRLNRVDILLDLAHLRITPEEALTELEPDWRDRYRLEHEVYEAEDGHRSVRKRR